MRQRVITTPKPWWHSRTLIFNAMTLASVGLAAIVSQGALSPQALKWIVVGQAVVNAGLRMVTKAPLAAK